MNYPSPVTPATPPASPAVTVVKFDDPTAVGQAIEVIRQDAVQLLASHLLARRIVVRLESTLLVYHSTNQPIRTRTTVRDGLMAFTAFGPQAAGTVNGLPVRPLRLLATPPGFEIQFVVAAGYESVAFLVPPDAIRAHLQGRQREGRSLISSVPQLLETSATAAPSLFQWGQRVVETAARHPDLFDVPQARSAAEMELIETLLGTFDLAVDAAVAPHDLTRQVHSRVVRAAEDYALAHCDERLYVTNLCAAAGVSERTLQYAFKKIMGMTPVAYLTRLRLHRVRQALRAANRRSTTVTREALKWGFWHFGDFSRAYKDCFGELPSQTLRGK